MARPAKSAAVTAKHLTNAERSERLAGEQKLKGKGRKPTPPKHLSAEQKKIFKSVVKELEEADILCALDSAILAQYSIAKDMLRQIDNQIAEDPDLLASAAFMSSRKQYMADFFRCTNELCLSPQSRAKMANIAMNSQQSDPLLDALRNIPDDDEEDSHTENFDSVDGNITIQITDEFEIPDDDDD